MQRSLSRSEAQVTLGPSGLPSLPLSLPRLAQTLRGPDRYARTPSPPTQVAELQEQLRELVAAKEKSSPPPKPSPPAVATMQPIAASAAATASPPTAAYVASINAGTGKKGVEGGGGGGGFDEEAAQLTPVIE